MNELVIDSEFRDLLPPLSDEQKRELEKDIVKNGCINSLTVWNNILIDGHHRHEICVRNNIPFDIVEIEFKDRLEAMEWIWLHQKNRRNLTKYELAQIALKFKPVIEAKAKENKVTAIKQAEIHNSKKQDSLLTKSSKTNNEENFKISSENFEDENNFEFKENTVLTELAKRAEDEVNRSPKEVKPINTRKEIAKIAGVSEDTIHKVEVIEEKAPEEIKQQVKKGDLTINSAYVLTKSAIEAEKKNAEHEKKYQEQLEKEKQEQEAQRKLEEIEKSLPENAVVLDKFRKPEETHIFGIEDFNNLTTEQFNECVKHSKKYQEAIHKINALYTDEDSLRAWNCIVDSKEIINIQLESINTAIQKLISIQNYFKGVKNNGPSIGKEGKRKDS